MRHNEVSTYDRFVVLGVDGTRHVFLCFTQDAEHSKRLMGNWNVIKPGLPVWLLSPRTLGYMKGTQSPLITTGDPLIPCESLNIFQNPPSNVNVASYVYFDFQATNLKVLAAMPKEDTCIGRLCDAQGENQTNCPCISTASKKHWALEITVTCDELCETVTGDATVRMCSNEVTRLFNPLQFKNRAVG